MKSIDFSGEMTVAASQYGKEKDYWLNKLSGNLVKSSFPYDFKPTNKMQRKTDVVKFKFSPQLFSRIMEICNGLDQRVYIILLSGILVLIEKYTGNSDIIVGVPIYKQASEGNFINTVMALRNHVQGHMSFRDLLLQVRQTVSEAGKHQNYPIETLLYNLNLPVEDYGFPLFDVALLLENIHDKRYIQHINHNVTFSFTRTNHHLEGELAYNGLLYNQETCECMINHYLQLLQTAVFKLKTKLSGIEILSGKEKRELLLEFNNTRTSYPHDNTIDELFKLQVAKMPGKSAVVYEGQYLTYQELDDKSDQLASFLTTRGVTTDTVVGIMVDRSLEMVVGLIGILKAGGAYLPIDYQYPPERKRYMLADSHVHLLLTNYEDASTAIGNVPVETLHLHKPGLYDNDHELEKNHRYNSLAYIIYTSGSTGNSKGVMVDHRSVVRLVKRTNYVKFPGDNRILQTGALEFDASTFEIWGALLNGGGLYLVDRDKILMPEKLKEAIRKYEITTMWMTAPLFNQMLDEDIEIFRGIRELLVGGDVLSSPHINRLRDWFPGVNVINGYGPTENTTFSTTHLISSEDKGNLPIGKPIANSSAYIVNTKYGRLVPIGVAGELWVGGDGVARGYLNNPELTFEKFKRAGIIHSSLVISSSSQLSCNDWSSRHPDTPIPRSPHSPIYLTGDLARWLRDGNIEFLGRMDHQVKIRGYRVEPEEVKNNLLEIDFIREAVVIPRETTGGEKCLCAYVVPTGDWDQTEARDLLAMRLPDYMIPAYFVEIEKMPLTPNKKVDTRALPEPEIKVGEDYIAPRNDVEEKLVEIWSQVLGLDKGILGIDADFFELGGHSLKATMMISKIHKELNVNVPLAEIFQAPTIRDLARFLKRAVKDNYAPIEAAEKMEYYELSSAQKRLYILQQMEPAFTSYNVPVVLVLEGNFDAASMEEAFRKMIKRHESLRTSFELINEQPIQRIHPNMDFAIEYFQAGDEIQEEKIIRNFVRPFDLSRAPLIRAGTIKVEQNKHILMVDMHHIITDGTSMAIFVEEFMLVYDEQELPALNIQYKDHSLWQNKRIESGKIKKQEKYWLNVFEQEISVLQLPIDYTRSGTYSFEGSTIRFMLEREETTALKKIAQEYDVTLFMLLLAIFDILLYKLSGQGDIIVGTPIAGRRHVDVKKVMGMFVNTLALRNYPNGEKPLTAFLKEVKKNTLEAFENQDFQFEELVEKVTIARDAGHNPLFDVMFGLQNVETPEICIKGRKLSPYEYDNKISMFDLSFIAVEDGGKLDFSAEYCTKLFKPETIERFISYFKNIVSLVLEFPGIKLSGIDVITAEEKKKLLHDFNDTGYETGYPQHKTIHELFQEQVEETPDHTALMGTDPIGTISYKELNRKANQVARILREKNVKSDTIVGLMVERTYEMIIGILGILNSGGAYLPIDPNYPEERKAFMLKDSEAQILITQESAAERSSELVQKFSSRHIVFLHPERIDTLEPLNLKDIYKPGDPAYVIYTSGTTGAPKGVVVEHKNVTAYLNAFYNEFEVTAEDIVLQQASYSFDAFIEEVYPVMLRGGRIVIPGREEVRDILLLTEIIVKNCITMISCSPLLLNELNKEGDITKVKTFICGGDVIKEEYIDRIKRVASVYNTYGPTESTVCATYYRCGPGNHSDIPIGKPIANYKIHILDKHHQLVPMGVPGELCISSPGLTRGYLNRPELTIEKFVKNPYVSKERMYKTGDLARWCTDGNIVFLGRIDHQVKIRGYRIELGEIESQLLKYPGVRETVVLSREDDTGGKYLCAYMVSTAAITISDLRSRLSSYLPDYMIPSYFIQVKRIPLTPGGKVDHKALPGPELTVPPGSYAPPGNEKEEKICEIWSEVLNLEKEKIGIDNNFFSYGGHSLKAAIMTVKIHKTFNVKIPLKVIFKAPTIRALCQYLENAGQDRFTPLVPIEKRDYYRVTSEQKRLYILQQKNPHSTNYNLANALLLDGEPDTQGLEDIFRQLIQRHESLRTVFDVVAGKPVQRVLDDVPFVLEYSMMNEEEAREWLEVFITPFDLNKAPLLQACLVAVGNMRCILMVDMHHIISDGISEGILIKEFMALATGNSLPPLRIHYKDFAHWKNSPKEIKNIKKQEDYWGKRFERKVVPLNLPADYPRTLLKSSKGARRQFEIGSTETAKLKELVVKEEITLYMVMLAIFNIFLFKLSGQEDIVVGTPLAGRTHADLEPVIGMFVNTLCMRNYPVRDKIAIDFLREVKKNTLEVFDNQDYKYEDLVEQLGVETDQSRNPLFDVFFALQDADVPEMIIPGLKLTSYNFKVENSLFDLSFVVREIGKRLCAVIEYSTDLFKGDTIDMFIKNFKEVLSTVLENIDIKLKNIKITHGLLSPKLTFSKLEFGF